MHASDQINITRGIAPITRRSSLEGREGRDNEEEDTRIVFLPGEQWYTPPLFSETMDMDGLVVSKQKKKKYKRSGYVSYRVK